MYNITKKKQKGNIGVEIHNKQLDLVSIKLDYTWKNVEKDLSCQVNRDFVFCVLCLWKLRKLLWVIASKIERYPNFELGASSLGWWDYVTHTLLRMRKIHKISKQRGVECVTSKGTTVFEWACESKNAYGNFVRVMMCLWLKWQKTFFRGIFVLCARVCAPLLCVLDKFVLRVIGLDKITVLQTLLFTCT